MSLDDINQARQRVNVLERAYLTTLFAETLQQSLPSDIRASSGSLPARLQGDFEVSELLYGRYKHDFNGVSAIVFKFQVTLINTSTPSNTIKLQYQSSYDDSSSCEFKCATIGKDRVYYFVEKEGDEFEVDSGDDEESVAIVEPNPRLNTQDLTDEGRYLRKYLTKLIEVIGEFSKDYQKI